MGIESKITYKCAKCGKYSVRGFFIRVNDKNGSGKTLEIVLCKGKDPKDWDFFVESPECLGTLVIDEVASIPETSAN